MSIGKIFERVFSGHTVHAQQYTDGWYWFTPETSIVWKGPHVTQADAFEAGRQSIEGDTVVADEEDRLILATWDRFSLTHENAEPEQVALMVREKTGADIDRIVLALTRGGRHVPPMKRSGMTVNEELVTIVRAKSPIAVTLSEAHWRYVGAVLETFLAEHGTPLPAPGCENAVTEALAAIKIAVGDA